MENNIDSKMLEDILTDFANKYGDQDCLDIIRGWQEKKLGKSPENIPVEYPFTYRQGYSDCMGAVRNCCVNLQMKTVENINYSAGQYQACIEILDTINKKGSELL